MVAQDLLGWMDRYLGCVTCTAPGSPARHFDPFDPDTSFYGNRRFPQKFSLIGLIDLIGFALWCGSIETLVDVGRRDRLMTGDNNPEKHYAHTVCSSYAGN